jgi:hypothetical protein
VTKHPSEHRFACHTFMSEYSTEPVAKAIGYVVHFASLLYLLIKEQLYLQYSSFLE